MKRIFSAMLAVLLTAILFCGCSSHTDAEGVKVELLDDNGNVTGYERRYHNSDGLLSRLDVYDADDNYDHYVLYEYDDDDRLTKESTYRADGIGDFYYTYSYNDDGEVIEKGYYTAYEGATVMLYDDDGNITEVYSYDNGANLYLHEVKEDGEWHMYDGEDNEIN